MGDADRAVVVLTDPADRPIEIARADQCTWNVILRHLEQERVSCLFATLMDHHQVFDTRTRSDFPDLARGCMGDDADLGLLAMRHCLLVHRTLVD